MKTIKYFVLITILAFTIGASAALFSSCDNLIGLGQKLDLYGPEIAITAPASRKAVPAVFTLEGIISDDMKPIRTFLVTAEKDGVPFAKQWRYDNNKWEVSEDFGASWNEYKAEGLSWVVTDSFGSILDELQLNNDERNAKEKSKVKIIWSLPVDLSINGEPPPDGEYLFTVQTWDTSGNSEDKSISTRVLIIDRDPPKVYIVNPVLYERQDAITENDTLVRLHAIQDNGEERFDPGNIGRFLTQGFDLQWQVDDNHDVRFVDIRFYKYDTVIDQEISTPLPDDYIYRYSQPVEVSENSTIKPSGKQSVPALSGTVLPYDGELKNPITEKTTIKVVAACSDAAGNPNQEKVLGYIIYWPLADEPWIIYTEDMEKPYDGNKVNDSPLDYYFDLVGKPRKDNPDVNYIDIEDVVKAESFMIYPGRTIRANAYHNHGVAKVNFKLYTFNELTGEISALPLDEYKDMEIKNEQRPNGSYSTIFPWEFRPPARSGYFIVEASTTSAGIKDKNTLNYIPGSGRESPAKIALFRVQDITFPDFPEPVEPSASDPLFMHVDVEKNTVTISGIVRDATMVETLDLVWINPQSAGFATQNQIRFFREPEFTGWMKIEELLGGSYITKPDGSAELTKKGTSSIDLTANSASINENYLENQNNPIGIHHPNKIWRLKLEREGEDSDTRQVFSFSITLNLGTDLNIAINNQSLKSQTFLLKAKNPDNRSTIITYAPQGDESPPVIKIDNVVVDDKDPYIPQQYALMPRFTGGETITINGSWHEDSAEYLPIDEYFSGNFEAEINGKKIPAKNITVSYDSPAVQSPTGKWMAVIEVGQDNINANDLLDSLVIEVKTKDFGGNVSSAGGSWLVESDDLRLLRISSNDDGTKKAGEKVTVFIEFSKAVQLRYMSTIPVLLLNSTGTGDTARAVYIPNASLSTRHEFEYTVLANNNTPASTRLNVTGIEGGGTNWNQDNYPFTWVRGSGDTREEIRVTMNSAHAYDKVNNNLILNTSVPNVTAGRLYARRLPVTTVSTDAEYQFTLGAGKNIIIDTQAPTVTGIVDTITGTTAQHYKAGQDIYIKVTFSENVKVGTTLPRLQLRLIDPANSANTTTALTSSSSNDVRVSGQDITFKYTVVSGNTTGNNPIVITGHTGDITDLAGTALATTGISNLTEFTNNTSTTDKTIQNRFINTIKPGVPVVRLLSSNTTANDANAISNYVNGTAAANLNYGRSNASPNALSNVYHQSLWIAIQASTASATGGATFNGDNNLLANTGLEYSVIDHPTNRSWVKAPNVTNSPFEGLQAGTYRLVARQINRAGIESDETAPITFTWDPGELITRISSTTANGTYTNADGRNQISITVYFRKNVSIAANSTITLNARRGAAGSSFSTANPVVTLTRTDAVNNASSITYTYNIQNGDNTPDTGSDTNKLLDVTAINITAWDGTAPNIGVRNNLTTITHLAGEAHLNGNKQFTVSTGTLTNTAPSFINDSSAGTGYNVETNSNFHGIRTDDGSYWTTLEIPFNRPISKGTGNIEIIQNATNYRVPSVLTETQYNRFRGVANFDTYYFRGTNGYINNQGADISTKYVLQYNYNPTGTVNSNITGDAAVNSTFIEAFRQAEKITIPVAAQAVTIDGNTVKIRLSGSNAPQVPGATYEISYPVGFVQDDLGNSNAVASNVNVTLRGVAKPFVRIRKTQDTIAVNDSPSMTQPRLVATQPQLAYARMDTRTPGATIRSVVGDAYSTTTGNNWSSGSGPTDTSEGATRPNAPTAATAATAAQITLGTNTGANAYQGYQWWVRAIATATVSGTAYTSYEAEEMAFRTVITYQLRNGTGEITAAAGQSIMESGDQIWLRGGDAIGSSSIPGYPFTWEDDWKSMAGKRAGIRLMTVLAANGGSTITTTEGPEATTNQYVGNVSPGASNSVQEVRVGTTTYWLRVISNTNRQFRLYNNQTAANNAGNGVNAGSNITVELLGSAMTSLNNSTWRFVTWDINTTAYVDFIRGRDLDEDSYTASSANQAWQYGPVRWAYQRAGWTSAKYQYPIYPGKHRWCDAGQDDMNKGAINFSGTFSARDVLATNYTTYPGLNTP